MATPRDKFIELRKSGVDAQTARKQAYGDITPAMNAPVAQTVNDLGGDVANRQNTRNVATNQGGTRTPNGAIMNADGSITQTPESMNANAGSTIVGNQYDQRTPEQKAIGAPATPEQAKKSTGGIVPEVTQPTQPTQPVQQTQPNQQAQPVQPVQPAQPVQPVQPTQPTQQKQQVQAPPTPRDIAVNNKLTQYAGMSSQQFLDQMKTGQIPSAISSQLAQTNPEFQKAQQEHSLYVKNKTRNDTFQSVYNGLTGKESAPQTDPLTDITNKFMKLMGADAGNTSYVEAFKNSLSNNEAVRTKTKELNAKQAEINEKIKARDDLLKEYKLTYKDTPLAILVSMAAQDAQPINEEIATLQSERDLLKSDLTYETELAKGEYDAMVKDMERGQRLQDTLMQAQLGLISKQAGMQMEADFARQQAYENLNDPATAISNVMEEYKKLGIPFTSTVQSRLAEFQASGKPLAQFLTEMTQNIQQSPGYKAYEAKKAGEGISYQTIGDKVYKNQNGVLTETNISTKSTRPDWVMDSTTGTWIDRNTGVRPDIQALSQAKGQTLLDAPDGMVIPSRLSETTNPNGGKECAEYVNDITGIGLGNSWESKKSKIDDTIIVPETGDTAIWIPDPSNKTFAKYGHAGVVTGVSEDGSMVTIKSSNLNGDGAISTITVPISQIDQTGGFAKSSIKGQGTSQNSGLKTLGEYIIDTQPRGAGFSDADAKAFTDSVNKYVKAGDATTVYQMLRDKILQNKQVGETIYDNAELKSGLSNLKTILTEYKVSGGDTGILSNIAETVANKLGTTTDVQLAKAKNQLGILVADYIRAISGTAASDTEVQRLIGNMPQMKNVDSFNMTLLDNLENIANRRVQSKLDIYLGSKKNEGKNLFPEFYGEIEQQPQQPRDNELDSLYNSL